MRTAAAPPRPRDQARGNLTVLSSLPQCLPAQGAALAVRLSPQRPPAAARAPHPDPCPGPPPRRKVVQQVDIPDLPQDLSKITNAVRGTCGPAGRASRVQE